ncbi:hypothetical protein Tco_0849751 [Tanacetum coccineum]
MSDSDESGVTHTEGRTSAALQAPPSPDYVPGPEEPEQAPPSPDYVPGPELCCEIVGGQPYVRSSHLWQPSPDAVPELILRHTRRRYEDDDMDIDEEDEDAEMDHEEGRRRIAPAYPVVVALTVTRRAGPEVNYPPGWDLGLTRFPGMRSERAPRCAARTSWSFRRLRIYSHMEAGEETVIGRSGHLLLRDRRLMAYTVSHGDEACMSREAWRRAMDSSDLAHGGVISLRTTVHAQMAEIAELQSADRRRQRAMSDLLETDRRRREEMRELRAADRTRQQQIIQTLTVVQTLQREMVPLQGLVATLQGQVTDLQGQVMTLQGQVTTLQGQQGPAGGLAQPELPEEAGSSS